MLPFIFLLLSGVLSLPVYPENFDHDHSGWNLLLKKYVSNGFVNYKSWKQNDIPRLEIYLQSLSRITPAEYERFSRNEKLTVLINAYNAFTVKLILDNYPVTSIRRIWKLTTGISDPWKIKFINFLGENRNLDWIEHEKLRKEFGEPRIHFVIVCASISCPILLNESYKAPKLDKQLEEAKKRFLSDVNRNRFEKSKNILHLSKIFDWFSQDFTQRGPITDFIGASMKVEITKDAKIEFLEYDWALNEQK